jgi:hypothetical protein
VDALETNLPSLVGRGELLLHRGGHPVHLFTRLVEGHVTAQTAGDAQHVVAASLARGIDCERDEDLRIGGA